MPDRIRLDSLLVQIGLAETRARAQALVGTGSVTVDGVPATKPSQRVRPDASVTVSEGLRYVSRGGLKLEAALAAFGISVQGAVCADVGASTGGFTDCLLQHGASRVYAIDVGHGQLAVALREDPRVVVMEDTDARLVQSLPEEVAVAAVDVSFISLALILPTVVRWLAPAASVICLAKPQFELGPLPGRLRGVVRSAQQHREAVRRVACAAERAGLSLHGVLPSPLAGASGNAEFLMHLRGDGPSRVLDLREPDA